MYKLIYLIFIVECSGVCVIGYRDAQVGWVEVMEDVSVAKDPRHALFLVIYAPRRGLLEVC